MKRYALLGLSIALCLLAGVGCNTSDDDDDNDSSPEPDDDDDDTAEDPALGLAVDLAETWMRMFEPEQNAWSWDSGVMMMGLLSLSEATGDDAYVDYARQWIDHYLNQGFTVASSDTSIPGYTALQLYKKTGEQKYMDAADRVWDYIQNKAGRTSDGGLNHMGWISGNQIWVDSLFMVGPFLLQYAELTGALEPYEEFALQLNVFRKHLRDESTGLYRHRYDDDTGELMPDEPLYWGRGNGWVFVASNFANTLLPQSVIDGLEFELEADIDGMLETLLGYETVGGRFHTIVNRNDTYLETSAALLYAYGLCLDMMASKSAAPEKLALVEHWIQGAIDQIVVDEAGDTLMLGTSYGTSPGGVDYYQEVLKGENVAYGIGLFMLAVTGRHQIGFDTVLSSPSGTSDETYVHPPVPCQGVECGKYFIARGHFINAQKIFASELIDDPADPESAFFDAMIDLTRFGFDAVAELDSVFIGETTVSDLIDWLVLQAQQVMPGMSNRCETAQADPAFSAILERLLIIENGGASAIGRREFDLGEAYLVDAIAHLVQGVAQLLSNEPALISVRLHSLDVFSQDFFDYRWGKADKNAADALDQIVDALDILIVGIESIMAETDDQADDFLPKNLLELTGTFTLPGVLPETDVMELLVGLGLPANFLEGLDMPADLLAMLETLKTVLGWVSAMLPG